MSSHVDFSRDSAYLLSLQERARADNRACMVGGLIVNPEGKVLLLKRSPNRKLFPGRWDITGGKVEEGETLCQALDREIMEETGWKVKRIVGEITIFDWQMEIDGKVMPQREFDFLIEVEGDLRHPQIEHAKFSRFQWVDSATLDALEEPGQDNSVIFGLARRAFALLESNTGGEDCDCCK